MCSWGTFLSQCPFKLLTGGAATAGTSWRHVSDGFESQALTNSGQTQVYNYAGRQLVQSVVSTVHFVGRTRICATIVQHRADDGQWWWHWWEWVWYLFCIFMHRHAVQHFETNRQYFAALKQIRLLILMFCINCPATVKFSAMHHVVCLHASRVQVHPFFHPTQRILIHWWT